MMIVSDRIARLFNISGATQALGQMWHAGLPHNLKYYGISGKNTTYFT